LTFVALILIFGKRFRHDFVYESLYYLTMVFFLIMLQNVQEKLYLTYVYSSCCRSWKFFCR